MDVLRPHRTVTGLAAAVRAWPVESQQRARRNAMIASTALARRRVEREDADEFVAAAQAAAVRSSTPTGRAAHA